MQYVFNLCAAPTVNGLIVVTNGKQVAMRGSEHFDNLILHFVGVLKLVHENVAETPR